MIRSVARQTGAAARRAARPLVAGLVVAIALAGLGPPVRAAADDPATRELVTERVLGRPAGVLWRLPATVETGLVYRTWSIDEPGGSSSVDQLAMPVYVRARPSGRLAFSYLFHVASSTLSFDGGDENTLSGVTDGKASVDYRLADPRFSLGAGLRVPTGPSRLDSGEENVAQVLIDRMLGFHVRRYGEGTDLELRGGFADARGRDLAFAAGLSYVLKGGFEVSDAATGMLSTYEPGNEVSLFGALRALRGPRRLDASLRYVHFQTDQRDGADELGEGQQVVLQAAVTQELTRALIRGTGELVLKDETVIYGDGEELSPVRDVGGNILRLGTDLDARLDRRTSAGATVALTWFGATESGTGDGFQFQLGPRIARTLAPGIGLEASWTFMDGHAEENTIDLRGHALSVGIVLGGGAPIAAVDGEESARRGVSGGGR
ncbi:MAG: hypothetical protein PVF43_03860 [Candidatus Eiseniibacteriota bacterium]|jgi:hypothetical protein